MGTMDGAMKLRETKICVNCDEIWNGYGREACPACGTAVSTAWLSVWLNGTRLSKGQVADAALESRLSDMEAMRCQ
jgi:hypothetical protein